MHLILFSNIRKEFSCSQWSPCWFSSVSRGWCWNSTFRCIMNVSWQIILYFYCILVFTSQRAFSDQYLVGTCFANWLTPVFRQFTAIYAHIPLICFYFKTSGDYFCFKYFITTSLTSLLTKYSINELFIMTYLWMETEPIYRISSIYFVHIFVEFSLPLLGKKPKVWRNL
jgi:hypothetical protein